MRSNGYYRQPLYLSRTFQVASRRLISREKQKLRACENKFIFPLVLALVLPIFLIGCARVNNPIFPDPSPAVAEQIKPCLKEGSELHDWIDKIYKLKDQINA